MTLREAITALRDEYRTAAIALRATTDYLPSMRHEFYGKANDLDQFVYRLDCVLEETKE